MENIRQQFTVASVSQSKRRGETNLYTQDAEMVSVWVVRLSSNAFPERWIELGLPNEVEAQRFSIGHVCSFEDIGELYFS